MGQVVEAVGPVLDRLTFEHPDSDQVGPVVAANADQVGQVVAAVDALGQPGDEGDRLPVMPVDPHQPPPGQQPPADQSGEGAAIDEGPGGQRQDDESQDARRERPAVEVPDGTEGERDGAFLMCGKHEQALHILRAAGEIAPEEVSGREAALRLVRDILATAPISVRREAREYAESVGVIA
ncbi:hypothetical protein [Nonomuraea roseola]|uniref:hypothetical protein n=1 Tax=Nonomuraea roseola TaxID=46179 RepID=UPI0031FA1A84